MLCGPSVLFSITLLFSTLSVTCENVNPLYFYMKASIWEKGKNLHLSKKQKKNMCEMCKTFTNKNKSLLKNAHTHTHRQNKHSCVARNGTHTQTDTRTVAVGQKVGAGPAVVSVRDSLGAGPVERGPDAAGLTHSFMREGGCFSCWNTQGLATLTSFNLICIRAIFGGKHRFSLRGIYGVMENSNRRQIAASYPCSGSTGEGMALYFQTSGAHTHTHSSTYLVSP